MFSAVISSIVLLVILIKKRRLVVSRKRFLFLMFAIEGLVAFCIAGAILILGRNSLDKEFFVAEARLDDSIPISQGNFLEYSVRIAAISSVLNKAVSDSNINMPQITLFESAKSYRQVEPGIYWVYVDRNEVRIALFRDVADKLTPDEVIAYAVHEIGHVLLKHPVVLHTRYREIEKEEEADQFAIRSGINPDTLISAIKKLAADGNEKNSRIKTLEDIIVVVPSPLQ